MRRPSFRVGRVLGVPIEIDITWFAVFLLVGAVLALDFYPSLFPGRPLWVDALSGIVSALLFFTSLVIHELSHSLVARRFDIRVERITLFLFGGIAQLADEPDTPARECLMAVAGPGASLVLAAMFAGVTLALYSAGAGDGLWAPAAYLAVTNVALATFNMAPGFPMDGGRVLRAYLWWATGDKLRATFIASCAGVTLALGMGAAGIWLAFRGDLSGLWLALVAVFLGRLAIDAYRAQADRLRLAGTAIGSIPVERLETVDADDAPPRDLAGAGSGHAPMIGVVDEGILVGFLLGAARQIPLGTDARARDMVVRDPRLLIDAGDSAETASGRFGAGVPGLAVVEDGRCVGVLTPQSPASRPTARPRMRLLG